MSKYDEVLNELVYQIDDIVYGFYSTSNEIISSKRSQERLITFRDNALTTLNDMNVRSLELIAGFKNKNLIEERAEKLLAKNQNIVDSALLVLTEAPNRSDVMDNINEFASSVIHTAKDVFHKVEKSDLADAAKEELIKAKESLEDLANNPKVIEGTKIIKEKTKDAYDLGSQIVKDQSRKFAQWIADLDAPDSGQEEE